MKSYIKFLAAFLLPLVAVACAEDEKHTPGEPDLDGCYGVYFPAQTVGGEYDPADPTVFSVKVARTATKGEITVPIVIEASEEGVFSASKITFADGEAETEFNINFDKAEVGTDYSCKLSIVDPLYASVYSVKPTYLSFNLSRVKWNDLGKAVYTEDCFTTFFNLPAEDCTFEIPVEENDKVKGYYRFKNVWTSNFPFNEEGDYDASKDYYFFIHAEDPENVYFDQVATGCDWGYGQFYIWSLAGSDVSKGNPIAAGNAGKLVNGVIKFPAKTLLIAMADYQGGGFYYANQNGAFKIVLPGGVDVDYSLDLNAGVSYEGKIPVEFTLGPDVAKVKYAVYEGTLNDDDTKAAVNDIISGSKPSSEVNEDGVYDITLPATGKYTLVAVAYDAKDEPQNSAALDFNYLAADDEMPVNIKVGLTCTDKYAPKGYTSENSLEFYMYGSDLITVRYALLKKVAWLSNPQECMMQVYSEGESLSAAELALANGEGYSSMFGALVPGTGYTLLVYASNGFEETFVSAESATEGDPLPIYQSFGQNDIQWDDLPAKSDGYFGTYNYYAVDQLGKLGLREYLGQVTIADSSTPDSAPDEDGYVEEYVNVSGLFGPASKKFGFDDTHEWDFYGGILMNLGESSQVYGQTANGGYFTHAFVTTPEGNLLKGYDSMLIGAYVADGYIAFMNSGFYQGYVFDGLYLGAFADEACTQRVGHMAYYTDLLLVDPAKDDNGLAPAPGKTAAALSSLNAVRTAIQTAPMNYVETPKGRIRSIIDSLPESAFASYTLADFQTTFEHKLVSCTLTKSDKVLNRNLDKKQVRSDAIAF